MTDGRVGRRVTRRVVKEGRAGAYLRILALIVRRLSFLETFATTSSRPLSNSLQVLLRALCRSNGGGIATCADTVWNSAYTARPDCVGEPRGTPRPRMSGTALSPTLESRPRPTCGRAPLSRNPLDFPATGKESKFSVNSRAGEK